MLVQFSVNNFKSIKDTITFSMVTSSKDKDLGNSFNVGKFNLLKSAVIYGANASGKSNFLKAMSFMGRMVLNKNKVMQSTDILAYYPFKLNSDTNDSSSFFEIVFFIDDVKYRYGFDLDNTTVYEEWLYSSTVGKESKLFHRDIDSNDYVNQTKFKEGFKFFDKENSTIDISENQLFIWKCDQNGGTVSKTIFNWFNRFNVIDGIDERGYTQYSLNKMQSNEFKSEMVSLVKTADIGIDDIVLEKEKISSAMLEKMNLPIDLKEKILENGGLHKDLLNTYHKLYDKNNDEIGTVVFDLYKEESKGTRKFFKISAPILNTLREGKVLIVDELDASLHPMLTQHLVELFHDEKINTKKAQLIFATHDTNMLSHHMFRRDQIWLTEKDRYGITNMYLSSLGRLSQ